MLGGGIEPGADWWGILDKEQVSAKANCCSRLTVSKLVILSPKDGRASKRVTGQYPQTDGTHAQQHLRAREKTKSAGKNYTFICVTRKIHLWSKLNVQNHNRPERFDPKHKPTREGTKQTKRQPPHIKR